jgi:hypothetical protein
MIMVGPGGGSSDRTYLQAIDTAERGGSSRWSHLVLIKYGWRLQFDETLHFHHYNTFLQHLATTFNITTCSLLNFSRA